MSQARTIVLAPKATYTSSFTSPWINIGEGYSSAIFMVKGDAATGTTPTLNIRIQGGVPDSVTTDKAGLDITSRATIVPYDWQSLTQLTTSAIATVLNYTVSGTTVTPAELAITDGSLAAANFKGGPIPAYLRIKMTIAGTNPSYANLRLIVVLLP